MPPPPPATAEDKALLGLLRGLANPHRHRVFAAVCERPLRGKEVSGRCAVTPQEASRHLARLTGLGLLARDGRAHRATDLGRRVHGLLQELRALQGAQEALAGLDLAAVPPWLPLAPLLAARAAGDARAEALEALRRARGEVLLVTPEALPAGEGEAARGRVLLTGDAAMADAVPLPLPARAGADVRAAPGPRLLLVHTGEEALLALADAQGRLAAERPFRGSDPAWLAWCKALFEHHAARAAPRLLARSPEKSALPAAR